MGSSPTRGSSFFLGKVTALGVLCCVALPCCLFDLACLLLPSFSHLSFKHVYTCTYVCLCMQPGPEAVPERGRELAGSPPLSEPEWHSGRRDGERNAAS